VVGPSYCSEPCVASRVSPSDGLLNKHLVDRVYYGARRCCCASSLDRRDVHSLNGAAFHDALLPRFRPGSTSPFLLHSDQSACFGYSRSTNDASVQRCWPQSGIVSIVNESCAVLLNGRVTVLRGKCPPFWINCARPPLLCLVLLIKSASGNDSIHFVSTANGS
jgi:hypothetical protein